MSHSSPLEVVQAQLEAYNAKNIEALLATYSPTAEQYATGGELLAQGHEQMRRRFLGKRPAIPPWLGIGVGCR